MAYINEIVIASIDVLGLGTILESENGTNRASEILRKIWLNTCDNYHYSESDWHSDKKLMFWESSKFGDSVYIFGNPDYSIKKQTEGIIIRVTSLLALGIYKYKIFLRCGIAIGDLSVNNYKFENAPEHLRNHIETVYIGTSMNRAHKLQNKQDWIGGALASNVDFGSYFTYLKKYNIPLKDSNLNESLKPEYALNWIKGAYEGGEQFSKIDIKNTNKIIDQIAVSIGNLDDAFVKTKIDNTKKFVNTILRDL